MRRFSKLVLLIVGVSVTVAFAAAGFDKLLSLTDHLFFGFFDETKMVEAGGQIMHRPYLVLFPAVGGLLTGLFLHFVAKGAKPSVQDVIARIEVNGSRIPARFAAYNAVASSLTIGSGGSAGPEGSVIQIGSALGSGIGGWFKLSRDDVRTLLGCGAAAGFGALFGTPIAGIVFVLEVLFREINTRRLTLIAFASLIGYSVTEYVLNMSHRLVPDPVGDQPWNLIPFYIALGFIAAPFGVGFSLLTARITQISQRLTIAPWWKPALGGVGVGLIGLFFPRVFGVGEDHMRQAIVGGMPLLLLLLLPLLKLVATSLTIGSGGAGGIFVPSMFIGATLGAAFGLISQQLWPGTIATPGVFAIVGMGVVLAAVIDAPLTAILLILELSGSFTLLPGAVAAVAAAALLSGYLHPESMYTMQLSLRGIKRPPLSTPNPLAHSFVHEFMRRNHATLRHTMTVAEARRALRPNASHALVADAEGKLFGVLNRAALGGDRGGTECENIARFVDPTPTVAFADETLHDVLRKPKATAAPIIPVVDRDNRPVAVLLRDHLIARHSA